VRTEAEMQEALGRIQQLNERAVRVGVEGHREYHSGWHTSIDARNLLSVSEAITRSAIERKESRGGHFREDYPDKGAEYGTFNIMVKQVPGGGMQVSRVPIPPMPQELKQVVEEQKS
jgi:succinate dehydrogenase / fumarate reductase, flavoprotein subunit